MMRNFGLIALLVVLLLVAWLSMRQMTSVSQSLPGGGEGTANVRERSQQIQKQVVQEINKAMQQEQERRDIPDEAK